MRIRNWSLFAALAASVVVTACVDSPDATEPTAVENDPLATTFDALAQEQSQAGDTERSEEFRWAALAVRAGLTPTRFEVTVDGVTQSFDAFVHAVQWTQLTFAMRPMGFRSFVGWRRDGDVMQVILISSHTDDATVMHPYSMRPAQPGDVTSPVAGALAAYFERSTNGSAWIGITGEVELAPGGVTGACHPPNDQTPPAGVSCQLQNFDVGFDFTVARTAGPNSRQLATVVQTTQLAAVEQQVAGVRLTFSCVAPTSMRGCN